MKLKSAVNRILLIYGFLGGGVVIFGGFMNDEFFVLFGLCITIIGLTMATSIQVKHLTDLLKKHKLWDDQIIKKEPVKEVTLDSISDHNKKQNEAV